METGCKMSSVVSDLSFAKKFDRGDYSSRFFLSFFLFLSSLDSFINVLRETCCKFL